MRASDAPLCYKFRILHIEKQQQLHSLFSTEDQHLPEAFLAKEELVTFQARLVARRGGQENQNNATLATKPKNKSPQHFKRTYCEQTRTSYVGRRMNREPQKNYWEQQKHETTRRLNTNDSIHGPKSL